jgi:hypothetical protein
MVWLVEAGILLVVAVVLRRALHLGRRSDTKSFAPNHPKPYVHPLCSPLASEVEAHATILGVLLNDVIEEQNSGKATVARETLALFDSEWNRLVKLTENLQELSLRYLPTVQYPIDARSLDARSFQSQPLSEFIRRNGDLDEFVFRSKLRFQLQVRLLARATALLNESFEELRHDAEQSPRVFDWALSQIDLHFHDLDRLAKETLLGFNEELGCIPDEAREELVGELSALTTHQSVVRSLVSSASR